MANKVTIKMTKPGDWVRVILNDEVVADGHSFSLWNLEHVLTLLGVEVEREENVSDEEMLAKS